MPVSLKLTPARVREYEICSLRFERMFLEVGRGSSQSALRNEHTASMSFGSSLHAVLDGLHGNGTQAGSSPPGSAPSSTSAEGEVAGTPSSEYAMELLARHWESKGYLDKESADIAFQEAAAILRYYLKSPYLPSGEVLGTELYLTCLTTLKGFKVELSCRVDRAELHSDGTLELLDYKTSRGGQVPTAKALTESLSTFLYFAVAWHNFRHDPRVRNVSVSQLNLMSLSKVRVQYDQRQVLWHREMLGELVGAVMKGGLQPRPNPGCAWCAVREGYPAWAELNLGDLDGFEEWQNRSA